MAVSQEINAGSDRRLDYHWPDARPTCAHAYLWPALRDILASEAPPDRCKQLFDLGCGNGAIAHLLSEIGYAVTGIDASEEGIRRANAAYPDLRLEVGSAYDDLAGRFGQFSVVISLEVIEHLYAPRALCEQMFNLLAPGGG